MRLYSVIQCESEDQSTPFRPTSSQKLSIYDEPESSHATPRRTFTKPTSEMAEPIREWITEKRHVLEKYTGSTFDSVQRGVDRWIAFEKTASRMIAMHWAPEDKVLVGVVAVPFSIWASRRLFSRSRIALQVTMPWMVGLATAGWCFRHSIVKSLKLHNVHIPPEVQSTLDKVSIHASMAKEKAVDWWESVSKRN